MTNRDIDQLHRLRSVQVAMAIVGGGLIMASTIATTSALVGLQLTWPGDPRPVAVLHTLNQILQVPLMFVGAGVGYALAGRVLLEERDAWQTTFTAERRYRLMAMVGVFTAMVWLEPHVSTGVLNLFMVGGIALASSWSPSFEWWRLLLLGAMVASIALMEPAMTLVLDAYFASGTPNYRGVMAIGALGVIAAFVLPSALVVPAVLVDARLFGALADGDYERLRREAQGLGFLWLGRLYQGVAAMHQGDPERATAHLEPLNRSRLALRSAAAWAYWGWVAVSEGDLDTAYRRFSKAAELGDIARSRDGLAVWMLLADQPPEHAREQIDYALENAWSEAALALLQIDRFAVLLATRAWVLAALGDVEASVQVADDALARCDRDGLRAQVLWRLSRAAALHDPERARALAAEGATDAGLFGRLCREALGNAHAPN